MTDARWPYCEATPECHDANTRQYVRRGPGEVSVTVGSRNPTCGIRLCQAHALIMFGVA